MAVNNRLRPLSGSFSPRRSLPGTPSRRRSESVAVCDRLPHPHGVPDSQMLFQAPAAAAAVDLTSFPNLTCHTDFLKPDALRQRPMLVEGRILYVDDYYLSIWSPIFKEMLLEDAARTRKSVSQSSLEIVLPGKRFSHLVELLECIYPSSRGVSEENIEILLPLAYEYQITGVSTRCIDYLKTAPLRLIDKMVLADRFSLEPLMSHCLGQIRMAAQVDFHSEQYASLSDKTKVRILERFHAPSADQRLHPGEQAVLDAAAEDEANMLNLTKFLQPSDLFFGVVKSMSGRIFHCNAYYLAAWSNIIHEQVVTMNNHDLVTKLTEEELVLFLLAIHPPWMKLTDANVPTLIKAACKMDAPGLLRKAAEHLLYKSMSTNLLDKLHLLDRCYLHELLEPCLRTVGDSCTVEALLLQPTYDFLSTKAKACILDRMVQFAQISRSSARHLCDKCCRAAGCDEVKWICPNCGSYCVDQKL